MTHPANLTVSIRKQQIFLVEDHPLTRKGLIRIINQEPDLEVCGEAATAAQAMEQIEALRPNLTIVDISLKGKIGGLELINTLASRHAGLLTMVLSTHNEGLYAERALQAGARGYLMKSEPAEHVIQGIRTILNGKIYLSRRMNTRLLHKPRLPHPPSAAPTNKRLREHIHERHNLTGQEGKACHAIQNRQLHVSTPETSRAGRREHHHVSLLTEFVQRAVDWFHSQCPNVGVQAS